MDQLPEVDKDALYQFSRARRAEVMTKLGYEVNAILALLIGFDEFCFSWRFCFLLQGFQDSCNESREVKQLFCKSHLMKLLGTSPYFKV